MYGWSDPPEVYNNMFLGVYLVQTCGACPEQYDAFYEGQQIGYFRLRHGTFRVDSVSCDGETVFRSHPKGDGIFDDDERAHYLRLGVVACLGAHLRKTTTVGGY